MADQGPSTLNKNPSKATRRTRTSARKEYDRKRDNSKVYLLDVYERSKAFKEERGCETDKDVAELLLNEFISRGNKTTR